ncbi:MAG: hypothetical protein ACF8XB_24305 [Planctomycetota bacterium JB042]
MSIVRGLASIALGASAATLYVQELFHRPLCVVNLAAAGGLAAVAWLLFPRAWIDRVVRRRS